MLEKGQERTGALTDIGMEQPLSIRERWKGYTNIQIK